MYTNNNNNNNNNNNYYYYYYYFSPIYLAFRESQNISDIKLT